MKTILSSRTKRQLELLELIMDADWVTFPAASTMLNVPVKTLKSDIVELETLLAPATIETSKKYGLRLTTDLNFCKATIYQKVLKNSIEFQLIEKIFLHNFSTIIDLADNLYISISTIKRIVQRVNQQLQLEGFTINLKKMQLIGDPHSICNFMQRYFQERYGVAEKLLTPAQLASLDQVGLQIIKQALPNRESYTMYFSLLNRLRLYTYTVINLLKYNNENQLYEVPEKEFTISTDTHACNEFFTQFQLPLSPEALNTFFYLFFSDNYVDSLESVQKLTKQDHQEFLKYQKITHLIREIEKRMDCECHNFEDIFLQFYNLECVTHGRTYILYDQNKEFFSGVKNLYGHLPMEIIHSLQAIFYLNPYKEYMVYEAISMLFTYWPALLDRLEASTPTLHACLLFDIGMEYMQMLSERISYYLRGRFSCTPIRVTTLADIEKSLADYDCIITNIPEIQIDRIPTVMIPLIPDAKSFDKLMLVYEEHFNNG
ncbi:helix-turn-helix domain-containing protein [Enterococcus wangshanyuanii]|uniref:Aspartate aminotransferase n=1 Tax=Enterococcus wangshanyuanii TaxID=2005703 RepID=A0ABQ1PGC9_9ENTE|nr:helix-turn-helix domain-containing protein [Enterococcus wangshanyuanii]GGC96693.1 aspartate aminotransferase [Enterococcus wangshanyuanii]